MNKRAIGQKGEEIACELLIKKGYHIVERNYRCPIGEIDIIAYNRNTLVFIEVKYRTSRKYGYPAESVDIRKQKRIIKTAQYYLIEKKLLDCTCRFDVVEVENINNEIKINIIENAF